MHPLKLKRQVLPLLLPLPLINLPLASAEVDGCDEHLEIASSSEPYESRPKPVQSAKEVDKVSDGSINVIAFHAECFCSRARSFHSIMAGYNWKNVKGKNSGGLKSHEETVDHITAMKLWKTKEIANIHHHLSYIL